MNTGSEKSDGTWVFRLLLIVFPFLSSKKSGTDPSLQNTRELPEVPQPPNYGFPKKVERYKLEVELWKVKIEHCKLRAEEYRVRYEGLRTLEWNTIIQIYTGYAAIALAFNYLIDPRRFQGSELLAWVAIVATCGFYIASRYLSYRIQERLVRFGNTLENYMEGLDRVLHTPSPSPGTKSLGHQYYWTYDTQLILNTATFLLLLAFEIVQSCIMNSTTSASVVFAILALISVIVGLRWLRLPELIEKDTERCGVNQEEPGGAIAKH